MEILQATAEDIRHVALNMRERDFEEFTEVSFAEDRESLAELLISTYGARQDVMVGRHRGEPVVIGGTIETRPNVISLLFFATDSFPEVVYPLTKFITKELFPRFKQAGVHRIEAVSLLKYQEMHRWLEVLGLRKEVEELKGYGRTGVSFTQYAWSAYVC